MGIASFLLVRWLGSSKIRPKSWDSGLPNCLVTIGCGSIFLQYQLATSQSSICVRLMLLTLWCPLLLAAGPLINLGNINNFFRKTSGKPGFKPGADGSGSANTNHCAMPPSLVAQSLLPSISFYKVFGVQDQEENYRPRLSNVPKSNPGPKG